MENGTMKINKLWVEKPSLNEKEFKEIGIVVMDALNHGLDVRIVYWEDGYFKEVIGIVDWVDYLEQWVKVWVNDEAEYIDIDCLKSVDRL